VNDLSSERDQAIYRQWLLEAMEGEAEAYHFYMDMAHRWHDPATRKVFQRMAEEEIDPCALLAYYQADPSLPARFTDAPLAPRQKDERALSLYESQSPLDLLTLALKKSCQAGELYQNMAHACLDGEFQDFCLQLALMKTGHTRILQDLLRPHSSCQAPLPPLLEVG